MSSDLIETGLDVLKSDDNQESSAAKLRAKTVGLTLFILGIAESNAKRISKLAAYAEKIEDELFDPDLLECLDDYEKIDRYKLITEMTSKLATKLKEPNAATSWDEIESQLQVFEKGLLGDGSDVLSNSLESADLETAARHLLRHYGLS